MRSFRTVFEVGAADCTISHHNGIAALGSCFAEHIGGRLQAYKFRVALNPFGILYNPASIAGALERLRSGRPYEAGELFLHQGLWHSFDHHGRYSFPDREQALEKINADLRDGAVALRQADRLLLTLGTAGVFVVQKTGRIAANCHKLPGDTFERRRMSVSEIADCLSPVFEQMKSESPDLRIVLTVSPVRHLREGFIENQRSKAALLLAVEELCRSYDFAHYFPAYELLMDDLRDYRFYEADMVHPSPAAVDYIWEQFAGSYFTEETRRIIGAVQKLRTAAAHRPFHPDSAAHRTFVERTLADMSELERQHPFLDFSAERAALLRQSHLK
jgi:hypothetical protein